MGFYRIIEQQRVKSEKVNFGPQKGGGEFSDPISPHTILYIISTIRLRKALRVTWCAR